MLRWLLALLVVAGLVAGGAFIAAGRTAPPSITIDRPERVVGQQGELQVSVQSPGGALKALSITLQQNGASVPLFALDTPQAAAVSSPSPDVVRVVRPFGKATVPQ